MRSRLLITGGSGFIGSNFIRHMLGAHPDVRIVNMDKLTYAANPANLEEVENDPRYEFQQGDIADRDLVDSLISRGGFDAIVNFAAESHVDRSIMDSSAFVRTNVVGTQVLLDASLRHGVSRFVQISTDEVYGSLGPAGSFTEESPLRPNSPYAASKAAADHLVSAHHRTYGLDAVITRSSNNFGPNQFPEKFMALLITNALDDLPLPIYGDGQQVRDWIYVLDNCRAIERVLDRGHSGEVYNIAGGNEWPNIEIARMIVKEFRKPESLITHVKDRPGHDRRYSLDCSKITRELGWKPEHSFDEAVALTLDWYTTHRKWWEAIKNSSRYRGYYEKQYGVGLSRRGT